MSKSIHEILDDLREASMDERDKGYLFESLSKKWLEISPEYRDVFDQVWFYGDWATENGLPKQDVGIDLVAKDRETQTLCAIQCKFYAKSQNVDKKHIDSFFTALSKKHFDSGLIFSTSDKWSKHAESALSELSKPVVRIGLHDLADSGVDWSKFNINNADQLVLAPKKSPFEHQKRAINDAVKHFATNERGKLVMACGTGKTYTSLQIAEQLVPDGGTMLFLVPSIALLSQSLREWKREATRDITAYAVCSDSKVGKSKDDEDIQVTDLAYPATTDTKKLASHFVRTAKSGKRFTVIFSTYQSIDVVAKAQRDGVPEFDLIICDEAHRTTGVTLSGASESSFVRVHDNNFISAKKRIYMTATPRIYMEQSKAKAQEVEAVVASMDDESLYGEEFHRLNFGEAVSQGLLSDYKVLVLAVSQEHVSKQLQKLLTKDGELNLDDATKIVGCYNGLRKRSSNPDDFLVDGSPMKSAVAFSRSIKDSQRLADLFEVVTSTLNDETNEENALQAEADHVDGTFNMEARLDKLDWLKDNTTENTVRILSNARCLSEGVDVPALDAVLFLNPRDSQVDVVQSVGRVMRKSPGKNYGYVILPIAVPSGMTAEEALADNKSYRVVWQVLQALRSHDERFNAEINKIDLNNDTGDRIRIIGVGGGNEDDSVGKPQKTDTSLTLDFDLGEWKDAILAKIVQKVGERTYWENWAKDVADIASKCILRINHLVKESKSVSKAFDVFVEGLQDNLNPAVTEADAIEMLAQHLITQPVFDALFEDYEFSSVNPVSQVMNEMLVALEGKNLQTEIDSLDKFYDSVRVRASGITSAEGRQKVIKELYEKFFRFAFPSTAESLGIVYTPTEIVDFMIRATQSALKDSFGVGLADKGVHVLDPFTGTGTYIVRLLQSGLIPVEDLVSKYRYELHANELVLLAYYVAAINIEETLHGLTGEQAAFPGIVLTDTFQMLEGEDRLDVNDVFIDNNSRVVEQNKLDIRVIIGNPPYSVGNKSGNDLGVRIAYADLDESIATTYVALSKASLTKSLYDSYMRAFRWATLRLKDAGVVCFVTNGSWLDSKSADGFRLSLQQDFSKIYVLNLRGNQRTMGEMSRREGGKVFGEGSRTPISITLLVKDPEHVGLGEIFYHDIGDYLSREEKLSKVDAFDSLNSVAWEKILPNDSQDWINQRTSDFAEFIPLGSKVNLAQETRIFSTYSRGILSARDMWAYNFSTKTLGENMSRMIDFYNTQLNVDQVDTNPAKISWDGTLLDARKRKKVGEFDEQGIRPAFYKPYVKTNVYMSKLFNNSVYRMPEIFPFGKENLAIVLPASGDRHTASAYMTDRVVDIHMHGICAQVFPLYTYEEQVGGDDAGLFSVESTKKYAITKAALDLFRSKIDAKVGEEDIFYYVYAVVSHPQYQEEYAADLKKVLARVPVSENFWALSKAGRQLSDLQLGYEQADEYPLEELWKANAPKDDTRFAVTKMKFASRKDKSQIALNDYVTLQGIPDRAYEYIVMDKSPIDWIVDRYSLRSDEASGVRNDPNDRALENGSPDYFLKLIKQLVTVSCGTLDILENMPPLSVTKGS